MNDVVKEQIDAVIMEYECQVRNAKDKDTINKLYRQMRIWNRVQYRFAQAYSKDMQTGLNHKFNNIRKNAIKNLEV